MSPRPDVSAERKSQILIAAAQVFLQKGFVAARMGDIARAAGLSVGNLYRYFPSKLDITLELMRLFLEPSLQNTKDLLTAPGTSRERLENSFLRILQAQDSAMLTLYGEMYHLAHSELRVRELLLDYNAQYQELVAAILMQAVERGELQIDNPSAAAFTFQAIFDGFMQNIPLTPPELDLPAILQQTFDMLFPNIEP